MGSGVVSSTDSCVAVGCRQDFDGPTEIHFGPASDVAPQGALVFDGELRTPSRELSVCSVKNDKLLSARVDADRTRVRVFVNDLSEPDCVHVIFGPK